jgi:hypothetical protein
MPALNRHIIQKQVLKVEMEDPPDAFRFRNRLAEVFNEKILPAIEALFDEIGNDRRLIRIDKLQVDAGMLSAKNWENELTEKTVQKIRQSLLLENPVWKKIPLENEEKQNGAFNVPTTKQKAKQLTSVDFAKTFLFFLDTGRLPWFASNQIQLDEGIRTWLYEGTFELLKNYLESAGTISITRLVYQFDETLMDEIIKGLLSVQQQAFYNSFIEAKEVLSRLVKFFIYNPPAVKRLLYLPFFKWISIKQQAEPGAFYAEEFTRILQVEFSDLHGQADLAKSLRQEKTNLILSKIEAVISSEIIVHDEKQEDPIREKELTDAGELFVENAGLIILHPFLQPYFKHVGLTVNNHFVNEYAAMKAVLLSQYLVYGVITFDEHRLTLNKILCGYPVDQPLMKELEITKEEKEEATDLLNQVIQLWQKNKVQVNGTIEGFQYSFLQRHGKLLLKEKDWQLQVEQKAFDIVLSSLPWGIGLIKTPWMHGMLRVDWA